MFVAYYVVVFLFTFWAVSTHAMTRGKPALSLVSAAVMPFTLPLIPVIGIGFWLLKTLSSKRTPQPGNATPAVAGPGTRTASSPKLVKGAWQYLPVYADEAELREQQAKVCSEHGSEFNPPEPSAPVAIAMHTLKNSQRLVMLRQPLDLARYGWVVWGWNDGQEGRASDLDFYDVRFEQLARLAPSLLPYLALEEGFEVTIDELKNVVCHYECVLIHGLYSED